MNSVTVATVSSLKKKSDQIEMIPIWIKELKPKYGIDIKYVRLDNSGENKSLQKECDKQNLGIIFEFTAPGTPQQNSVVERKIPTLMGRSRAMMLTAGFSQQDKRKFWCEVISTATKLDNIMVRKERTKPPYTLFYNDEPKYKKYLRSFGEMAVIVISDDRIPSTTPGAESPRDARDSGSARSHSTHLETSSSDRP